jgi:cholest-4-en-3-one 26-monooxygenase
MAGCPHAALLELDNFAQGAPHRQISDLARDNRLLWEADAFTTGGHWLVLRQEDIDHVLHHPELFSSTGGPFLEDMPPALLDPERLSLNLMDPPGHRQFRALVDYAFRPALLRAREPMMRDAARQIIDRVAPRGECEFVDEVAMQLPMRVMFSLLGVRPEDEATVVGLTNAMLFGDDPKYAVDRAAGFNAKAELDRFGAALAADHRENPRDTITQAVLASELDGWRLSDKQFGAFFTNLIGGGLDTTRNALSWAMVEFTRHPDQYARLQAEPALLAGAAEEILRYHNPVVYLRRTATQHTELAGERIEQGAKLIVMLGAPSRDPALFERPDAFDITRPPGDTRRKIRTFGGGAHVCLGLHQARANLTIMLGEIAGRLDNPRLLEEPRHARSVFMDGFSELQLGFDARG